MLKNIEKAHNLHCSECKNTIIQFLGKLYKEVKVDHDFYVGLPLLNDQEQPVYSALQEIMSWLEAFRGHRNFVKIKKIPRCDLYVTDPGFVVELDESQHFSKARMVSLSHYPRNLPFGFKIDEWIDLCNKIKAVDNDPPYRDEQRAWYDTLRDFLPFMVGLKPTVRIYMGKFRWCSLDPQKESDIQAFLNLVPGLSKLHVEQPVNSDQLNTEVFYGPKWYVAEMSQGRSDASGETTLPKKATHVEPADCSSINNAQTISGMETHIQTSKKTKQMESDLSGLEGLYGPKWWRDEKNLPARGHPKEADRATLEDVVLSDGSKGKCNIQKSTNSCSNPINPLPESSPDPDPSNKEGLYGPKWYRSTIEHEKSAASGETKHSDETNLVEPADHVDMSDSPAISGAETQLPNSTETSGREGLYGPKWYQDGRNKSEKNYPIKTVRQTEGSDITTTNGAVSLATVVIQSYEMPTSDQRVELLAAVVNHLCGVADVILFPAGLFITDLKFDDIKNDVVDTVCLILKQAGNKAIVCFGVDAQGSMDQFAVAITEDGILALGKKFFPTVNEDGYINLASDAHAGDAGFPRTFTVKGKKAYLAVCYDSFGIKKKHVPRNGVDIILNLVHEFGPAGQVGGGDVFFARHGFAGCSREWNCPTFAAVVFSERKVPLNWPTGILWTLGSKTTKAWHYSDNQISQPPWDIIKHPGAPEAAYVRVFSV